MTAAFESFLAAFESFLAAFESFLKARCLSHMSEIFNTHQKVVSVGKAVEE
jgi:hypothetical protein